MRSVKLSLSPPMAVALLSAALFLVINLSLPLFLLTSHTLFTSVIPLRPLSLSSSFSSSFSSYAPFTHSLPQGHIHPLLHHQNLSHRALHSPLRLHLAALFQPRTLAVVGVEYGGDVRAFAAAGYRVHAVEPGYDYATQLRDIVTRRPEWDVVVHNFAATEQSNQTLSIDNQKQRVATNVYTRRLDHLITETLAVLSIDVQGAEPQVLRGASALMPDRVESLVVEVSGCRPQTLEVLRLLDRDYVLFDFVPRGDANRLGGHGQGKEDFRHMYDGKRPGRFDLFDKWLCSKQGGKLRWVQTDVLAVRRDKIAGVWDNLSKMGDRYCGKQGILCAITPV